MAISVNKVTLVGILGRDPEAPGRSEFATLSVATSRSWRKDGEKVEKTEWHRVVIFNRHKAKFALDYARKGDQVYIEGRLETRKYEKDGRDVYTTEVIVADYEGDFQLRSKERREGEEPEERRGRDSNESYARQEQGRSYGSSLDDEIPF